MSSKSEAPLEEITESYRIHGGDNGVIDMHMLATPGALDGDTKPTWIQPGWLEGPKAMKATLRTYMSEGVPAVGLTEYPIRGTKDSPIEPTQVNIEKGMIDAPMDIQQRLFGQSGQLAKFGKMDMSGRSGGAGGAMLIAHADPAQYEYIAATIPAGLDTASLGETFEKQQRSFWTRFVLNLGSPDQALWHPGNAGAASELLPRIWRGLREGRLDEELYFALKQDGPGIAKKLDEAGVTVHYFLAKKDKIANAARGLQALAEIGLAGNVELIEGSHRSSQTKRGREQGAHGARWLASKRSATRT